MVPDVTGKTRVEAQALLTEAGFVVGAVTEDFSDSVAVGDVISQQPAANSSAKKGIVGRAHALARARTWPRCPPSPA